MTADLTVDAPRRLEFEDGFADDAGNANPDMSTMIIRMTIDERPGGGARMAIETTFPSPEVMEQMVTMGMGGMTQAVGQIDALLQADGTPSGGAPATTRAPG